MTKQEIRNARKLAAAEGRDWREIEQAVDFTESARGYKARDRWARQYDECNGAPEDDNDR